jgi:hypothetical protein
MRKSYTGDGDKRYTVNLDTADAAGLEQLQARLVKQFKLDTKPSLSLLLGVALKRLTDEDPKAISGLWDELHAASKKKGDE